MALSEALDVLHRAMGPALYHCIAMAIEITSNSPAFFVDVDLLSPTTIAKYHGNNLFKLKLRDIVVHYYVISLLVLFGRPPSTMNAIPATICNDGRAIHRKHNK